MFFQPRALKRRGRPPPIGFPRIRRFFVVESLSGYVKLREGREVGAANSAGPTDLGHQIS
jgi:hypothetical protein